VIALSARPEEELVVAAAESIDGTAPGDPTVPAARRRLRRLLRRAWPTLRIIIGFALAIFALWALSSKTSELQGFHTAFRHFNWWWVAPAVIVEIASYFCFAAMQFELLKAGHLPGDHQFAADRQRGVVGLRFPLVPPLRR
jgi:hypothetical protein